jgi:demethoxyubiquinone hydroxylase (CLK1/Coq7/Cat5 family)
MIHQMNQLAAVRRCEDLDRRRRRPSESAAPPSWDCTGFEIGAGSSLVGFDAGGQYSCPFAEVR